MRTVRREKCQLCGEWALCIWSVDPIRRWCEPCVAEHDAFMAAGS